MEALIGNGLKMFDGDCRYPTSQPEYCVPGTSSSVAYPVDIVYDEDDNLYIADLGNNRVRMWQKATGWVITLAGNGQVGFSGDGGPGREATLRYPEGVAVKPVAARNGQPREVWFSDSQNQRIRRLVRQDHLPDEVWIITTVVGDGIRGDAQGCDEGCDALTAHLHNPRQLRFSSTGELYLADQNNFKVRRIVDSGNGTFLFSTWAGSGSGKDEDIYQYDSAFLAGHYSAPSLHVATGMIGKVEIDRDDQLWWIDALGNRIFYSPLYSSSLQGVSGHIGAQIQYFLKSFVADPRTKESVQGQMHAGMIEWMTFAGELTVLPTLYPPDQTFEVGRTYWRFLQAAEGPWCTVLDDTGHATCDPVSSQSVMLVKPTGLAFDHGGDVYMLDGENSEILKSSFRRKASSTVKIDDEVKYTADGCPCNKYWVELAAEGFNEDQVQWTDVDRCFGNPAYGTRATQATGLEGSPQVPCSTTDYCEGVWGDSVAWCYINCTGSVSANPVCSCDTNAIQSNPWGYCEKPLAHHSFIRVPQSAVFGNELRVEKEVAINSSELVAITARMSQDLSIIPVTSSEKDEALRAAFFAKISSSQLAWAKMVSFYDSLVPAAQPENCSSIAEFCCGLEMLPVPEGVTASGRNCSLSSLADISILEKYLGVIAELTTYWKELVYLTLSTLESNGRSTVGLLRTCEAKCSQDPECTGFLLRCEDSGNCQYTPPLLDSAWVPLDLCVFFSRTFAYHLYTLDRSQVDQDGVAQMVFTGPLVPYPRLLTTNQYDFYLDLESNRSSNLLAGPLEEIQLLVDDCQDACARHPDCGAIVMPGCYLLREANYSLQNASSGYTEMYIKEYRTNQVEAVGGLPGVYAYKGDGMVMSEALFDRPVAIAIDSQGTLTVADTWNHRIRYRETRMRCAYDQEDVDFMLPWVEQTQIIADACNFSDASLQSRLASAQRMVIEEKNASEVYDLLCDYSAISPNSTYLPTNNLMLLCQVCYTDLAGVSSPYCPPQELCLCKDAIAAMLSMPAYLNCPPATAHRDPWHLWATAYLTCWFQPNVADLSYYDSGTLQDLVNQSSQATSTR
eukprot:CAMPEP_0178383924 /NCGR_PEP_ID=MMETSP0689_2-20121128/7250_1 /TAXON_ID=160604 /ORGANISM="Amphidinium massartii, Strain CS-259" /LENGTH=1071 /DNA_ID=CAMNT_0020004155 /DNA_START=213 /DNA_END=3428 /DNA_ORIENTATION=+